MERSHQAAVADGGGSAGWRIAVYSVGPCGAALLARLVCRLGCGGLPGNAADLAALGGIRFAPGDAGSVCGVLYRCDMPLAARQRGLAIRLAAFRCSDHRS